MDIGDRVMKPSASVAMIRVLLKYAAGSGIDTLAICSSTGLDDQMLKDSAARIPVECANQFWRQIEGQTTDPNFGLHLGESMQGYPGGNLLFSVMMNCPTIGDAIDKFCRYHIIMNDYIQPRLVIHGNLTHLSWESTNSDHKQSRHISEALLCIFNTILKHLCEDIFCPAEVRFSHAMPADISEHQRIFQAPLKFEQTKDELLLDSQYLDRSVFLANPGLLDTLERYAVDLIHKIYLPNSWADKVIRLIGKKLQGQKPSIDSIASELALGVRSLQNKLSEENTTFQQLLDFTRKELAIQFMKGKDMTLCDIAFILGFSEQSAFNHAFKRWTGKTPKQYHLENRQ